MRRIHLTLDLTEYEAALLLERTVTTARRPAHELERGEWLKMARQIADQIVEATAAGPARPGTQRAGG
jgi:hypothetical protein